MIVFFGIAGSGKGTQADRLSKHTGWPTISSGEVLRQNQDNPTIKTALEAGKLVDDKELLPLLEKQFAKIGADKNEFILDGTPRNLDQARWLAQKIKAGQLKLTAIIHIKLSQESALGRLKSRGRHDDDETAIAGRFKFYEQSAVPAMQYLKSQGYQIDEISGEGTPEEVQAAVRQVIKTKK